ncbi:HD domain-containing phosphohydrolase [Desulfuribacillus alkaliarsenatis]|uniref:Two-component system response regulator n=1 Tax=Desulfuribacillus alkaliarsenatis TaxID=766136 RepID=A0A1E5G3K9_9FIRM|nr:HD domain-containing phosphohydrolase [Desulfuribacillus alkaliarsenatis]OEF97172.1 two-component system response regulator [Desulfuribacillus alkaliarsenatis]
MVSKILIVDDSSTDRLIISGMLYDYDIVTACDGREAMQLIAKDPHIDLMILDLNMPIMNGFEVLNEIKRNPAYKEIRTIILTNSDEVDNEVKGLKLGAVDYIRKPLNIESLRIRIDIHLRLKDAQRKMEQDNERLDAMVAKKTRELVATRDITIHALVGLLEVRNVESSNHTIRTKKIMRVLCRHLQKKEAYRDILTDEYINELVTTTPLHDIGKVGIPDRILLKPDRLTDEEYTIMKKHVVYGVQALKDEIHDEKDIPSFIKTAIEIAGSHHEKFDGTGYPLGLSGESIPLPGRLMAIIDVYDALMSKRVYKPAYDSSRTIQYITEQSGKHFDPAIVQGFLEVKDEIIAISLEHIQEELLEEAY